MRYPLITLLILSMVIISFGLEVNIFRKRKYCEYEWESEQQKEEAKNSDTYNPKTFYLKDVNETKDCKIFVITPRKISPNSTTLATVTDKTGGPLLHPYLLCVRAQEVIYDV